MKRSLQIIICLILWAVLAYATDPERKVLSRIEPQYPAIAQNMNLHGTVKLRVWISPDGRVLRLEYIGGHPLLAESALKAVKGWQYETGATETKAVVELKF